jgi:hypothetical protein
MSGLDRKSIPFSPRKVRFHGNPRCIRCRHDAETAGIWPNYTLITTFGAAWVGCRSRSMPSPIGARRLSTSTFMLIESRLLSFAHLLRLPAYVPFDEAIIGNRNS